MYISDALFVVPLVCLLCLFFFLSAKSLILSNFTFCGICYPCYFSIWFYSRLKTSIPIFFLYCVNVSFSFNDKWHVRSATKQ